MDLHNRAVQQFRRRLGALLVLKYALPLVALWGFVWGTAVIALRTIGVERERLLWGMVGVAASLAAALLWARRHLPTPTVIRALLDEQNGCGGLLMAGAEQELGDWRQQMPALQLPHLKWNGRRAGILLASAAAFVLASFLVPQGLADLVTHAPLEIDPEIGKLLQQIALLKSEAMLDPKRAEMLAEKAAQLREHSSGKDPAYTLEALDHLRQLAQETAQRAAEQSTRRSQRFGEAQVLAEALWRNADLIDPQLMKEVLAELGELLGPDGLLPELREALQQQKLDLEQLQKLAGLLRGSRGQLMARMEKLCQAGLIDAETLRRCRNFSECDFEELRAFLRDRSGKVSLAEFKSH